MGLIITAVVTLLVSILWVRGLSNMKEKYPDYKGEDFLNWDNKHPEWNDNKIHSEGDF